MTWPKSLCIFLASASCALGQSWTGWHAQAWSNYRLQTAEVITVSAVVNGPFAVPTYAPPYPSTNLLSETNTFLSDITVTNLPTGAAITNIWTFTTTDSNGAPVSVAFTNIAAPIATNLHLQARDILAFDSYLAMLERWRTGGYDGPSTNAVGLPIPGKPRYYRKNRAALVATKDFLEEVYTYFIDDGWSAPADFATTPEVDVWPYAAYAPTFLGSNPSNYFYFTPSRELHLSDGYARVITGLFTIATSSTNTITNTAYNSCGDLVTVVGTNGQQIAFVCTNEVIAPGFTSGDYGWGPITSLFARLTRTAGYGELYGRVTYGSYYDESGYGGDVEDAGQVDAALTSQYATGYAPYPWITGSATGYVSQSSVDLRAHWNIDDDATIITAGWYFHQSNAVPAIVLSTNTASVGMAEAYVYTQTLEAQTPGDPGAEYMDIVQWSNGVPPWTRADYTNLTGSQIRTDTIAAPSDVLLEFGNEQTTAWGITGTLFAVTNVYPMSDTAQQLPATPYSVSDAENRYQWGAIEVDSRPFWVIRWNYKYR